MLTRHDNVGTFHGTSLQQHAVLGCCTIKLTLYNANASCAMNSLPNPVSPQWLLENLDNPQLVIIDCRFQLLEPEWGYNQYQSSHILGSYFLDLNRDLSSPVREHGGRHPLPNLNLLAEKLAATGIIQNKTQVVVYDDSRFAFAARLWWLLKYLGHASVAVLDGGWNAWQKLEYPITAEIPPAKNGLFIPQPQTSLVVDRWIVIDRKDLDSVILLDSREEFRYLGEREPIDPVAGHIPSAINSPWQQTTDSEGFWHDRSVREQLWHKYRDAEEIIVYCGSGVTACVNILSLESVGIKNVKLYVGGWSDWCSYL
jgi:thiosulfate/3-mercaptopyruvate sulfurtransferase